MIITFTFSPSADAFLSKWLTSYDIVVVFLATSPSSSSLTDNRSDYFLSWCMWSCWMKGCPCRLMFIRRVSWTQGHFHMHCWKSFRFQTDWLSFTGPSRRFTACVCECVCVCHWSLLVAQLAVFNTFVIFVEVTDLNAMKKQGFVMKKIKDFLLWTGLLQLFHKWRP